MFDKQAIVTTDLAPLSHANEGPALLAMEDRSAIGLSIVPPAPAGTVVAMGLDGLYPFNTRNN